MWYFSFNELTCKFVYLQAMYKDQCVEFLVDESDSVSAYEKRGKDKQTPSSEADQERRVLEGMNRVQQIEMVQGMISLTIVLLCKKN